MAEIKKEELGPKLQVEKPTNFDAKRDRAFRDMVKTEGWEMFRQLLNAHINQRTAKIFEPIEEGKLNDFSHNQGAVFGLIFARDVVGVSIAAADEMRAASSSEDDE